MRFTKQLTALTCALALFAGGAHAREPSTCDAPEQSPSLAGDAARFLFALQAAFGGRKCETIGYTTSKDYEAVKTIETAPTEEVMDSALEAVDRGLVLGLFSSYRPGSFRDIMESKNKKSILGIAANGQKTRVHCPTTCTAGSLNRTAIQQGLPFMVPYEILKHVEERSEIGRTKAWHDVAAIIWSKEYSYNFKDKNAQMSRDYQVDRPDIHAARSAAKNISDNKQQSNGASDIKVTDGGTTADVVEVAAEDCDEMCLSERM